MNRQGAGAAVDGELPLADELSAVFARMSGFLLSQETVATALGLVTSLAKDTIPGSVGSGVTLTDPRGRRTTAGASDAIVEKADDLQYELDEGPCLDAWMHRTAVRVDDTATEHRWPRWCAAAYGLGMRSALSAPLVAADTALGAMKVYGAQPATFDERSTQVLGKFAAQAAILLANVQSVENAGRLSEGLRDAMRSRDVIGTAKGILMARERIDEDAALVMLVSTSQRQHQKVRDIAQQLVESTARRGH
ncbi:MAG TPA: GAF and ANTAR domain-containing protein [Acidimicrobiales bacterium]|nr:GAF and ANTAR domain-containing protein [Acidimicrobiales bacterium]